MGPEDKPAQVRPKQGSLFCLNADRTVKKHVDNIDIANGLAWSADHKTMYYIDSLAFGVDAFDYDNETGVLSKYWFYQISTDEVRAMSDESSSC